MKYKLIISDLDGTALRSDRTASERTRRAIAEYRAAGGIFTLSSGRMFESMLKVAPALGLDFDIPMCAMDGGIIKMSESKRLLAIHVMPCESVACFAEECEALGIYFQVYTEDKLFVASENDINRRYCSITKIPMNPVGRLSEYVRRNRLACVKALIADPDAQSYISRFEGRFEGMNFFMSAPEYLDGAACEAGKGNALAFLAAHFGVDLSRTAAVGDSMNDISMIRAAGLGVAVANADDSLLAHARYLAPSNDEDGLAYLLEAATRDELQ